MTKILVGHVALAVNPVGRELRQRNLEPLLDALQHFLVTFAAYEADTETLGTKTTRTSDTVQVGVGVAGQVVIDGQVDALDIDTTAEDVSGDADTLVELLEFLVALDTNELLVSVHYVWSKWRHTALLGSRQSALRWKGSCTRAAACRARWHGGCS